ncbi:Fic family protein [Virgibacillus natechei]|uniref:Fic family protein n=1 Tax=Virgibacillus natechei TaxID=1216297 RepID=A0ABS4IHE0_9BACI|nr:Fic family protein [Virgibacillus natechei]MBP1970362.1 Fic family protein [Virgibacillus natechei]UZD13188.1 Fic family protein [Virgibacillus natechei]
MDKSYLDIIQLEKEKGFRNGLYDYINVKMSYDTNRMEGSTLTFTDTQALYEKNIVPTGGHSFDDLLEGKNHFELMDFMLTTIDESLTERLIKEFHQILKKGTLDEERYGIGRYKGIPNMAGEQKVAEPHAVPELMRNLLESYDKKDATLDDVLRFHHEFELIHPFQDGNGRVGRLIMLRECLKHDITPFIISSDRKEEYINGLRFFEAKPHLLKEEVMAQQEAFRGIAEPFVNHYN